MREREYRSITIPSHLNSEKIELEFKNNITKSAYLSKNTPYNDDAKLVKNTLKELYDYKCAYCESFIKNSYGEIEHYRPKKSLDLKKCDSTKAYYWLAFSWDNLLPCCKKCNIPKSNCFDIFDTRVDYNNETLEELHKSLQSYNRIEKPKLLHPEIDVFEDDIVFDHKGFMSSDNEKVIYTSTICDLNRKNLREAREKIFTKYLNLLKKNLALMIELEEVTDNFKLLLKSFKLYIVDELKDDKSINQEYSLVSYYIYNNFEHFLEIIDLSIEDRDISRLLWFRCSH